MIEARWMDADTIEAPRFAETDSGSVVGAGLVPIKPDDPQWNTWAQWLIDEGQPRPPRGPLVK